MKKILIFSLAYYPSHVSGAETAIKDTTDRIDDIEWHLITQHYDPSLPKEEKIDNVLVHRVGFGSSYLSKALYVPLATLKGLALHKKHHFDALWAMMTYMLFPIVLMRFLGARIPYVLSLQDGDPYERVFLRPHIKPALPLLKYGFKHAAVVQVISKYLATWPPKLGYTGDIELIYDGANPKSIHPDYPQKDIEALRSTFAQEGDVVLMNTARLVHQKAADITIRALTMLPSNIKLVLVGDGDKRAELETLVKELDLSDRVIFTGQVDREVVSMYRLAADIFVGPSRSEGLGHAFLSAMACKLPVITTQVGGIADFLFDAKRNPDEETTGWAVDVDSPEQIAKAVKEILDNSKKTQKVIETAHKMVLEKYDWDVIAKDMRVKVFGKVLGV